MPVWSDQPRANPEPCREGDEGLFEIHAQDGRARLGRFAYQTRNLGYTDLASSNQPKYTNY